MISEDEMKKAQQELDSLRRASTSYYNTKAGKAQLAWLDQFETNLVTSALNSSDSVFRLSCLDQAKGVRAFRAYLETLTETR